MANVDERYQRGKVYTVRCRYDDTLIYVGSTIDKLAKRMASHRQDKTCSLSKLVNGDWNNWYIELYEEYPCDNKEQLERREGEVQRQIATINKRIAGRTINEYKKENYDKIVEQKKRYYEDNRGKVIERGKLFYESNRDEILEKAKQYREDNNNKIREYKKQYYNDNRDEIIEQKKQYYKDNRDEIREKTKDKCKCDICGAEITKKHLKKHQRTAKCMNANK